MPVTLTYHHNSELPFDYNLGSMVPAKGMQYQVSGGFRITHKSGVQLKLMPEWVGAQNQPFETMSQELNPQLWRDYFLFKYNVTDIPERMAATPYRKFLPGQSYLRYSKANLNFSISTESKWWGPGYRNALVLSSNAPGFLHFSVATNKAIQTRWGKIEGEFISGVLAESGVMPPRRYTAFDGQFLYLDKNLQNRYITGITLQWQPRWVKGISLGIAKASYLYPSDILSPLDILPLQGILGAELTGAERKGLKASLGSFSLRYLLNKEQAEVYLEYGRQNKAAMPWNALDNKPQRSGFVLGLRKLQPINPHAGAIMLGAEITQLQLNRADLLAPGASWYTHSHVLQGYTHLGKSLGAGIGPGGNSQIIDISWIKKQKRVGIQLERLKHNSDYYYAAMTYLGDFRRHWVQIGTTLKADWDFGPISLHGNLGMIRSLNHQWIVVEARPNYYFAAGNEYLNIASQLSVRYRF
ncbi:capsule assembly Wzi family protein [Cnuella takakiae]|nr:capsule assembly Wzi family protein [Cnuella takakiae]OLY93403.1 hypothetical protein BUE76_17065 [Cnuella takakiae]